MNLITVLSTPQYLCAAEPQPMPNLVDGNGIRENRPASPKVLRRDQRHRMSSWHLTVRTQACT